MSEVPWTVAEHETYAFEEDLDTGIAPADEIARVIHDQPSEAALDAFRKAVHSGWLGDIPRKPEGEQSPRLLAPPLESTRSSSPLKWSRNTLASLTDPARKLTRRSASRSRSPVRAKVAEKAPSVSSKKSDEYAVKAGSPEVNQGTLDASRATLGAEEPPKEPKEPTEPSKASAPAARPVSPVPKFSYTKSTHKEPERLAPTQPQKHFAPAPIPQLNVPTYTVASGNEPHRLRPSPNSSKSGTYPAGHAGPGSAVISAAARRDPPALADSGSSSSVRQAVSAPRFAKPHRTQYVADTSKHKSNAEGTSGATGAKASDKKSKPRGKGTAEMSTTKESASQETPLSPGKTHETHPVTHKRSKSHKRRTRRAGSRSHPIRPKFVNQDDARHEITILYPRWINKKDNVIY